LTNTAWNSNPDFLAFQTGSYGIGAISALYANQGIHNQGINSGTFLKNGSASGTDYATSSATIGLVTGDFNTDGTADAITIDGTTSKVTLTPGNGDGTLGIGLDYGFGIVSSPKPQAIYDGLNRLKTETNPLGKSRT
jgi:hypothetical protein